jgi:hypothetical protein
MVVDRRLDRAGDLLLVPVLDHRRRLAGIRGRPGIVNQSAGRGDSIRRAFRSHDKPVPLGSAAGGDRLVDLLAAGLAHSLCESSIPTSSTPTGPESQGASVSVFLGATVASNLFSAAAALLLIQVVRRLTAMQEARRAASNT